MVHMSSEVNIPMLSFTETILDGEQFSTDRLEDDYLDLLPPGKFRAEFLGRNWGPMSFFLPEFRGRHAQVGTPNLAAYLLLHDVGAWPMWSDGKTWNRLYDALDAQAISAAAFLPYWAENGVHAAPGILVSAYLASTATLLAVVNTGDAATATLSLDRQRLRLAATFAAVDVLSGEKFKLESGALTVPLSRHQGRVILLKQRNVP